MCDCLKSYGEIVTDVRTVSTFSVLDVYDKIDVYYTQDTTSSLYTITVVTGKHLLSNVSTEVSGGVLQIKNNNKCNFVRGSHNEVTVYIIAPYIENFIQDGVGTIYSANTMKQDSVNYNINNSGDIHLNVNVQSIKGSLYGVGDIYLTGNAQNHNVNASGECFVNAQTLQTSYSYVVYNSTGQANVNVTNELDATISYQGNIYYNGNPSVIHKSGTGSGELIQNK
jgi:hypothetical protein